VTCHKVNKYIVIKKPTSTLNAVVDIFGKVIHFS
jgi:hypothetical protein